MESLAHAPPVDALDSVAHMRVRPVEGESRPGAEGGYRPHRRTSHLAPLSAKGVAPRCSKGAQTAGSMLRDAARLLRSIGEIATKF